MSDKQLQSAWETLNTHVKQLKGRIREQENTIKQLREELSKAKQVEANTKWVVVCSILSPKKRMYSS